MHLKLIISILLATLGLPLGNGLSPIRSLSSIPAPAFRPSTAPAPSTSSSTAFLERVLSTNGGGRKASYYDKIDWKAIAKYSTGLAAQMSLIFGFLTGIDKILAHFSFKVPFALNFVLFYAFNLKSSLFSILPSRRSDGLKMKQEKWAYNQRKKPSWTPPGFAFALGWPLLTFGLRAYTGAMVVQSLGSYANSAIMSLMLHFGVGTLWNTSNNVERRLGFPVVLLYGLWVTKAFAAFQFYKVEPLAGKLLALTLTWISAACALQTRSWQINPDPITGKREPLLPRQHPKWSTKFRWEQ